VLVSENPSLSVSNPSYIADANTVVTGRKVGPVPTRRYQEGCFKRQNGWFYSFFRQDRPMPDGSTKSKLTRFKLGRVGIMSEIAARREHDRLRQTINRERGSVPAAPKGETFKDVAANYMKAIAPHLSPGTVRQRQSHLTAHLLPRFGTSALMALDVPTVQQFTTDLLASCSRKTIKNLLGSFFAVLKYAKKSHIRVPEFSLTDLTLAADRNRSEIPYMKPPDVKRILEVSQEPYRTILALAWACGLRAGELLGLRVQDLDLELGFVNPRFQADDQTRVLQELKTRQSGNPVPMTPETVAMLKAYLQNHWTPNRLNLLFPSRTGRPMKRQYVVKFGLRPALVRLGLPTQGVGLHSFRRGLGTALANNRVSPRIVQTILRHSDLKTTLTFYVHSDSEIQREALQALQK
jgi:integrase